MSPSSNLIDAVAVTAELCGRSFSDAAARVFVMDLAAYPESQVIKALTRCRKEVRGILTVADVISRLDDGRPGVEEAWAMLPKTEADSAVWTDEMCEAAAVAAPLLAAGDEIAARMAFKEVYLRKIIEARDQGIRVNWTATLGHDPRGREATLARAVEMGRLTHDHAQSLLPAPKDGVHQAIAGLLAAPAGSRVIPPDELKRKIAELKEKITHGGGDA